MPGDDKDLAARWRNTNKQDRADIRQMRLAPAMQQRLDGRLAQWNVLSALPERTPAEIEQKKERFLAFTDSFDAAQLETIAAIPITQFYIAKTPKRDSELMTDAVFRRYWKDGLTPQGQPTATALATAREKRFFQWFLDFPEIIARGGFDCILGNPPYLGGTFMSGVYGHPLCHYVKWQYAPTGLSDLVVYFLRRIYSLLRPGGFTAFITTNSIRDGDIRHDGLEYLLSQGGAINFAVRGIRWPGRANLIVSLVSLHKGPRPDCHCVLDGNPVSFISAFFEDYADIGEPKQLQENAESIFAGSQFRGDGFLLTHDEASALTSRDPHLEQVIFPVINGQEINSHPELNPGRKIINFFDWELSKAEQFGEAFQRVSQLVKPERDLCSEESLRKKWWLFERARMDLYNRLGGLPRAFVTAITTKHLSFSAVPANCVYLNTVDVLTTDRWDLYAVVQSTLHEVWARKYSGALKQDLRYSPSKCFETFTFPVGLWQAARPALAAFGERYHEHRKSVMLSLWLGLTDIYNLFHARDLTPAKVAKISKKSAEESARGYAGLLELRRLHVELDIAVRDAYGWQNLPLDHDFYEVETLAENDRVRFTVSAAARKEILRRLLALNHDRAEAEKSAAKPNKPKRAKKAAVPHDDHIEMFPESRTQVNPDGPV